MIRGHFIVLAFTPAEIAETNIEGFIAINFNDASFPAKVLELDKDKSLFFYCRSGNRSGMAKAILAQAGTTNVTNGGTWQDVKQFID